MQHLSNNRFLKKKKKKERKKSCTKTGGDCATSASTDTSVGSSSLLGLLAKIKCSICSYQFNI